MEVTLIPISGMFRHPVDGAHAAQVLRERGFSSVAIRPIASSGKASPKQSPRRAAIAGACGVLLVMLISGWFAGAAVDKVFGAIVVTSVMLGALLLLLVVSSHTSQRVRRYPRQCAVVLTVHCRTEDEPAVAETLRDNGAVEVRLPIHH